MDLQTAKDYIEDLLIEIERLRNQVRQLETERDQWIRQAIGRD